MNSTVTSLTNTERTQPASVRANCASARRYGLAALSEIVAIWSERVRFRWKLQQLASEPHLVDDIGMTATEVDAELAKRFWQK